MTEAVHVRPVQDIRSDTHSHKAVLRADGLVKSFRARKVVKGVSVEVAAGEVVGLLRKRHPAQSNGVAWGCPGL